jgi:hypothetical protein
MMTICIACDKMATSNIEGFDLCGVHYTEVIKTKYDQKESEAKIKRANDRREFAKMYPNIKMGPV